MGRGTWGVWLIYFSLPLHVFDPHVPRPTSHKMKIYLLPAPLSPEDRAPEMHRERFALLDFFVVENVRTARRQLSAMKLGRPIEELEFVELSEHTSPTEVEALAERIVAEGRDVGVMSEAGVPCVADPGAGLVAAAHRRGVEVVPLVGSSSILMALMASGASGQSFAFNGYLPIKPPERAEAIRRFERAARGGQTQLFIETPYRNQSIFETFLKICAPSTMLCVASNITASNQLIISKSIEQWRREKSLDLAKNPTLFIIF